MTTNEQLARILSLVAELEQSCRDDQRPALSEIRDRCRIIRTHRWTGPAPER